MGCEIPTNYELRALLAEAAVSLDAKRFPVLITRLLDAEVGLRKEQENWKPARVDAEGTAKPLTRLVGHARAGDCVGPGTVPADALEDTRTGERTSLAPVRAVHPDHCDANVCPECEAERVASRPTRENPTP